MTLPDTLRVNAWTGTEVPQGNFSPGWKSWATKQDLGNVRQFLPAEEPVDQRDWSHPKVGWGLILPENETLSIADRARGIDAPEPLQQLLKARVGCPVLRYRRDQIKPSLIRYYADGSTQTLDLNQSMRGIGKGCLPRYLLIAAAPTVIPWDFQYQLNVSAYVGRLHLQGEALENYVSALLTNWQGAGSQPECPVVWTVDHGTDDITWLMRHAIAEPVAKKLAADSAIQHNLRHFAAAQATWSNLVAALTDAERRPAFVLTTSHGMTGPLQDPAQMLANLGIPVDDTHAITSPNGLVAKWQPDGAIWYAHACCSAGSDSQTVFQGLVEESSSAARVLNAVAGLGAHVAPLPQALLGASRPLRAFIGHVEPTFDWTLRDPETKQVYSASLLESLYERLHRAQPEPVGMAFQEWFRAVGGLMVTWDLMKTHMLDSDKATREAAQARAAQMKLAARDRLSFVILGDPTVRLAPWRVGG